MQQQHIEKLSNNELVKQTEHVRNKERAVIADLILHLAEIDRRKIYRDFGYSSLFAFCEERLKFSKGSAYKRVQAVKVFRRDTSVYEKLKSGTLSLGALAELGKVQEPGSAKQLLSKAEGKSKEHVRELVAATLPATESKKESIKPTRVYRKVSPLFAQNESKGNSSSPVNLRTNELAFSLKLELDQEFMQLLERVKLLAPGYQGSVKEVLRTVLSDYEKRNCPKHKQGRREQRKRSGKTARPKVVTVKPKHIRKAVFAETKDRVYLRDNGQCTYMSPEGIRCSCKDNLEIDHVVPVARGGKNEISNLRLLCRAHNLLMAEKEFGTGFVRKLTG